MIFTVGRCLAHAQGWYESRRLVQVVFVVILFTVAATLVLASVVHFRRIMIGNILLVIGLTVALGFTALKGTSFHGLEHYYAGTYGPFRGADLIELSGIAIATLAALLRLNRQSRHNADANPHGG